MIVARAPLRISLGGGGTDVPSYYRRFGGFVISAAIDKYVYISINRPAADRLIRVKYSRSEEVATVAEIRHELVRESLRLLDLQDNIEIVSMADVPAGTGLGSSSTYLVSLLTALFELKRERVPAARLAEVACHVEMDLAGQPVGKQDQYLAAFGGITRLRIDCDGQVEVEPLPLDWTTVEDLNSRVLLFFTGMTRGAGLILEAQRQDTEQGNQTVLESLHQTREIGYQVDAALAGGDLDEFGRLLHVHWEAKKRRSGLISDARMDRWYEIARGAGALGGKIIGAGGGGFLMLYCPNGSKAAVRAALAAEGLTEMPYRFDFQGAKVLVNL